MTKDTAASSVAHRAYVRRWQDCVVKQSLTEKKDLHRDVGGEATEINYNLQEITHDATRGWCSVPNFFESRPSHRSAWHYHNCDMQVIIIMEGSAEFAFTEGPHVRAGKENIMTIPGGCAHDIRNLSADYQVAEFTFPGTFGTTATDAPPLDTNVTAQLWSLADAPNIGDQDDLIRYLYPLSDPYNKKYRIEGEFRCRPETFLRKSLKHSDPYRFLLVKNGTREIETEGSIERLGFGDVLVIPAGAECIDTNASDDYQGVWVSLLN